MYSAYEMLGSYITFLTMPKSIVLEQPNSNKHSLESMDYLYTLSHMWRPTFLFFLSRKKEKVGGRVKFRCSSVLFSKPDICEVWFFFRIPFCIINIFKMQNFKAQHFEVQPNHRKSNPNMNFQTKFINIIMHANESITQNMNCFKLFN